MKNGEHFHKADFRSYAFSARSGREDRTIIVAHAELERERVRGFR